MIVNSLKDQAEGDFAHKCKEAGCYLKQTELYYSWKNSADGSIKDLKRVAVHNILKVRSPKRLWCDCAELEAYIRSHTGHNTYCLNDEMPEISCLVRPRISANFTNWRGMSK